MTQPFPADPFLSGPTAPSGIECDAPDLIIEGELLRKERVEALLDEANQITAIMVASRKTAQSKN